jgi:hypothetical protein
MKPKSREIVFWLVVVVAPIAGVALAAFISYQKKDWLWFARSGSLLCVAGSAIFVRDVFIMGLMNFAQFGGKFGFVSSNGPSKAEIMNAILTYAGFGLATLGTLIWAYGDLIGKI